MNEVTRVQTTGLLDGSVLSDPYETIPIIVGFLESEFLSTKPDPESPFKGRFPVNENAQSWVSSIKKCAFLQFESDTTNNSPYNNVLELFNTPSPKN